MDINNLGQVVGIAESGIGKRSSFVWSATEGMRSLDIALFDCRINDLGMVVGRTGEGGDTEEVYLWTDNEGLEKIGSTGSLSAFSLALNNSGTIIWTHSIISATGTAGIRSYIYEATVGEASVLSERTNLYLTTDINDEGRIVGVATDDTGQAKGFYSLDGKRLQFLPPVSGQRAIPRPERILEDGTILIGIEYPNGRHGLIYDGTGYIDLGTLGGALTSPSDMNARFQVVGDSQSLRERVKEKIGQGVDTWVPFLSGTVNNLIRKSRLTAYGKVPFLWEENKMWDLHDLIPPDSQWELLSASAINDGGEIVGVGFHNGRYKAFLLTPIEEGNKDF
jgi:hypothetical protein